MKKILQIALTNLIALICFPVTSQTLLQTFTEPNNQYGTTNFGRSVAIAGDINNDGFDDMLVGAESFDGLRGRVHVFFGGENADSLSDIILIGETVDGYFGNDVSGAGDVNNDGFDDIIVGAYWADGKGAAYIYYGGDPMNTIPDVVITGSNLSGKTGYSVAQAGDINKDGYDDVIVGENSGYYATFGFGKAEIFFGGSPMDNSADISFYGRCNVEMFGSSVSYAGDVNGDSFGDIIIGSPGDGLFKPLAYIYYGGENMDRFADVTLNGSECIKGYACSVSSAGDVNKDGFDDVIVGSYTTYSTVKGKAYIYYGGENMDNVPDVEMAAPIAGSTFGYEVTGGADLDMDGYSDVVIGCNYNPYGEGLAYVYKGGAVMDNKADLIIQGEHQNEHFGISVSMNGDINNDGYNDILSGSINSSDRGGSAFLYLGGMHTDSILDLKINDVPGGNCFGNVVSSVGDVNGDGYDDMISGSKYNGGRGRVYLYFGSTTIDNQPDVVFDAIGLDRIGYEKSISSAGDCNNDGYKDIIIGGIDATYLYYGGSSMDNQPDVVFPGENELCVSYACDFNKDGYDDVIIGRIDRWNYDGEGYIYFGGSNMDNIADIILQGEVFSRRLGRSIACGDINNDGNDDVILGATSGLIDNIVNCLYIYLGGVDPDGVPDIILSSDNNTSDFGFSIDALDFNNDGYCDVLAGAYNDEDGKGKTYLYYGGDTMDSIADLIFEGSESEDNFGRYVCKAGDLNKDNIDDIIIGANDKDWYTGNAYIYYGSEQPDTIADFKIKADGRVANYGFSISSAGDMNDDGNDEIIIGAPGKLSNGVVNLYDFHLPKKNQSVTFGDLDPVTYGARAFALSGESTSGLPVKYTSSDLNVAAISWNTVTILNAGTAVIKAFQPGNMELDSALSVSRTLIVNKAILNVTADNTSKVAGSENPQFSISYDGFINSDNENDLDEIPMVITDATNASPVGTYVLSPWGGSDNNYIYNYINGILSVNEFTSTHSPDKSSDVLFPNPAWHFVEINVDSNIDQVVIYNAVGDILIQTKVSGKQVDVSALKSGVYFLKLGDKVYKFVRK